MKLWDLQETNLKINKQKKTIVRWWQNFTLDPQYESSPKNNWIFHIATQTLPGLQFD